MSRHYLERASDTQREQRAVADLADLPFDRVGMHPELAAAVWLVNHFWRPRPLEEWGEDDGPCLWYAFPLQEPPYVGSPLDDDWPGYHTHWTPLPTPLEPS